MPMDIDQSNVFLDTTPIDPKFERAESQSSLAPEDSISGRREGSTRAGQHSTNRSSSGENQAVAKVSVKLEGDGDVTGTDIRSD